MARHTAPTVALKRSSVLRGILREDRESLLAALGFDGVSGAAHHWP